ncbi:pimeloyl-ACP methyl ester carboxylesterase [Azospirillum fermentarium]|uniref:S8 family serine peptidase n=1 Tax=Azospirillum fermentarium TaxID=1233114 RepID=UPI00222668CE|nr:S8 family serine peptidase [Azospirillum fermentarium]MCW2247877.1 pimeloyl-ACP methyl ester carboxylesterase [Azospirillum fermentarium]
MIISSARPHFTHHTLPMGGGVPMPLGADRARTVVYIHGIGNKPSESVLKCQWDTALFGHPMGDRTRMAYWVNRNYYPRPEDGVSCGSPDHTRVDDDEASPYAIMALAGGQKPDPMTAIQREIDALSGGDRDRKATLEAIAGAMLQSAPQPGTTGIQGLGLSADWLWRLAMPGITRAFLRDVHDFFYVDHRKTEMTQSLSDRLAAGGGPFVIIGHSQGSMIAYEVLRRLKKEDLDVELFLTIGSPLGLPMVQERLRAWDNGNLAFPPCVRRWVNVADPLDPVALDKTLNGEFSGGTITDLRRVNLDSPRHPHSGTGYLGLEEVRAAVRDETGSAFGQVIAPFAIAGNLVERLEDGGRDHRHHVLIELAGAGGGTLAATGAAVETHIHTLLQSQGIDGGEAEVERLRRYVCARLTRLEVEALRSSFQDLNIGGIWHNAEKRALIAESAHTVQAHTANHGYNADGRGICWAVLDTGIQAGHPHFQQYANVTAQYDCTTTGTPAPAAPGSNGFINIDRQGHGTHVAGIIAGRADVMDQNGKPAVYAGMAPRCSLMGFKVLDDNGMGRDAWIIKALETIFDLNENARELTVHGINLSLGSNFDPSVYGTGHTPLCRELRRLWGQGVLICVAAGNAGFATLNSQNGTIQANMDISIGDPANLEECIAVGSVHKTNPHTYGISYFSSRGPTADGRRKPDLVAPGERIVSARHDWAPLPPTPGQPFVPPLNHLYVEMSGTSMAAPHVSGILAAFLSRRREFIGYPDRVKRILLDGCVDLQRDPYMQGAGLPNLVKMLALN